jgi:hypothetical protein
VNFGIRHLAKCKIALNSSFNKLDATTIRITSEEFLG